MGMISKSKWGTRQSSPTLAGIRDDHMNRYRYAGEFARRALLGTVIDVGCGTGYGSYLMASEFGLRVYAYEIDPDAIKFGEEHYSHPRVDRLNQDIAEIYVPPVGLITAFEIIEHFDAAPDFLARASKRARFLIGSVPNQSLVAFDAALHPGHVRHYTTDEIRATLEGAGWKVLSLGCQLGKRGLQGEIRFDRTNGRTIIFVCES